MMEQAGIDMLPPQAGIPLIRRELTAGATRGEVVVAERLGILVAEWDSTGGLDTSAVALRGPMMGNVAGMTLQSGLRVETTLDPSIQPFLNDHRIDGRPVLPAVMGVEAFAEAAACLLPDWHVHSVENVDFAAPFKFYRDQPRTVCVEATLYAEGGDVIADCRLTGIREIVGQTAPQISTHFTGRVRLKKYPPEAGSAAVPNATDDLLGQAAGIYRIYFHGPAYRVLERVWRDNGRVAGVLASHLPENHRPADLPTLMAPRLIELCFQTAGIQEISDSGRMALPEHLDSVSVCGDPSRTASSLYAVVTAGASAGSFDVDVVDAEGNACVRLKGYRTIAL